MEGIGYRVLIAADGLEALKIVSSHEGPVDLLITDLIMPGMNGAELARRVKEHLPGIHTLFISGYSEDARRFGEIDERCFLQKPFAPQVLAQRVREMLDRPGQRAGHNGITTGS